jgi:hypothetical protein
MRAHKLRALGVALLVVSGAGSLPLITSSSFSDTTGNSGNLISAAPDWVAPTVSRAAIGKAAGGSTGYIRASGTYYIYAAAGDTGAPASGIGSVTANVTTVTTGQTAVPLVAGTYTAGGVSYQYRSAQLTAKATLAAGPLAFSVAATDQAANSSPAAAFSVTGDNTVPSAFAVQATNVAGGTLGKPELGDTLTLTYSETMDWSTILAGWDGGTTTNVGLVLINGGSSSDYIQIYSLGQVQLPLGNVYLNRTDVAAGGAGTYVTFGETGTPTTMTASGAALTFVAGTASGTVGTAGAAGAMTWTPSTAATDRAGNASTATTRTESGTSDRDF